MTKTIQKQLIALAMAAVTILLVVLLGTINIANCVLSNMQVREIMQELSENNGTYHPPLIPDEPASNYSALFPGVILPDTLFFEGPSPDSLMGARYFKVAFDASGSVVHTDVSHIYAVTEEDAQAIANKQFARSIKAGLFRQFAYQTTPLPDGSGSVMLFLDISTQQSAVWTVLLSSLGIGALCWAAMFLVVIALSKKAIQPIAKNIERQKQFVTNAGHEIKTPLSIILANTDAMELINGTNKWSRNIRAQAIRLNGLMQNLLTLSKMDESGINLPMSEFSVQLLLEETLDLFHSTAESRGLTLQTDFHPCPPLHANRDGVMQLFSILLDNATKYTPAGGTIHISLKEADRRTVVRIKNTCDHIPDEELENLFERFYRGDAARTQSSGGYGIGLSAARAIAQTHNGSVTASYAPEEKAITFTVIL